MKCKERVELALSRMELNADGLDKLLVVAYYMGRESKAVEVSDRLAELLARMRERANGCRFRHLANSVIDDEVLQSEVREGVFREYVYDSDYSCSITEEVGSDETVY